MERRRPVQHERRMQAGIIRWARNNAGLYPPLRWLVAIPNGGHRDAIEAANLKREGVTPGVSDLLLLYDNGEHAALWMELKIGPNKLTDEQVEFQTWAMTQGHLAVVCRTTEEAIAQLRAYLCADDPLQDGIPADEVLLTGIGDATRFAGAHLLSGSAPAKSSGGGRSSPHPKRRGA